MIAQEQIEQFNKDGFLYIQDVFSKKDVDTLREKSIKYFEDENNHFVYHNCGKVLPNAFEYFPYSRNVLNAKITNILKSLLGDVKYVYHSDLHYNMFNDWHRDLHKSYIDGFDTPEKFSKTNIYKVAIYLQDHTEDNLALTVKPGSHNILDENLLKEELVIRPKIGSILIFDQRLMHKGDRIDPQSVQVCKNIENSSKEIDKDKFLYFKKYREENNKTKLSIFFGIAKNEPLSIEFAKKTMERQNRQNGVDNYRISDPLKRHLTKAGLIPLNID